LHIIFPYDLNGVPLKSYMNIMRLIIRPSIHTYLNYFSLSYHLQLSIGSSILVIQDLSNVYTKHTKSTISAEILIHE